MAGLQESPLYPLINEINKAASSGLPFIALAMCVTLPDICVSLSSQDGRSSSEKYKAWCDSNLGKREFFGFVTSADLWSMRCGVLHNGRFGDLKHNVGRVIFALSGATFVNSQINDAYIYSVKEFCGNFTQAVCEWFEENRDDATIQMNLPRLMQHHPNGIAPYIVGIPVLA